MATLLQFLDYWPNLELEIYSTVHQVQETENGKNKCPNIQAAIHPIVCHTQSPPGDTSLQALIWGLQWPALEVCNDMHWETQHKYGIIYPYTYHLEGPELRHLRGTRVQHPCESSAWQPAVMDHYLSMTSLLLVVHWIAAGLMLTWCNRATPTSTMSHPNPISCATSFKNVTASASAKYIYVLPLSIPHNWINNTENPLNTDF